MLRAKPAENTRADCKQGLCTNWWHWKGENLGEIPASQVCSAAAEFQPVHCTGDIPAPGRSSCPFLEWSCYYNLRTEYLCIPSSPWAAAVHWPHSAAACEKRDHEEAVEVIVWTWNSPWKCNLFSPHLTCLQVASSPMKETAALVSDKEWIWNDSNAQVFLWVLVLSDHTQREMLSVMNLQPVSKTNSPVSVAALRTVKGDTYFQFEITTLPVPIISL